MCQMCCCGSEPGLGVIPLVGCPREWLPSLVPKAVSGLWVSLSS